MYSFAVLGNVPSKKNNYRRGANGGLYKPAEITAFEEDALWQLKAERPQGFRTLTGPVLIRIDFLMVHDHDLDNVVTTILDILQKGEIIKNDNQVRGIKATKNFVTAKPECRIGIEKLEEPEGDEPAIHL